MADYYLDQNGTTQGFGTLSQTYAGAFNCGTSALGTGVTSAVGFGLANPHVFNLGSAATSLNTLTGTVSIANSYIASFNGIRFQNLTTTQTISGLGTGFIVLGSTNPFIDVNAVGRLDITCRISGTVNWEKRSSGTLRLTSSANSFSAGMTIAAGTVEIGNALALSTGTVTMTGGKLSSSSTTGYTVANALTLNGTMTLGDTTNNGALAFNGTLTLSGATTLTTSSGVTFNAAGTSAAAYNLSATAAAGLYFTGGAGTFAGGTASFLGTSSVFLANFNSGTPNQLVGFSTIALSGGSNIQILGNTTHTFANAFTGTASDVIYSRNTSLAGLVFNGTMSSYLGSLRIYADSVEGANPVQKVTLTQASQYAFSSFLYQSGSGLTTLSQTLSYTGTSNVSTSKTFNIFASALTSGGTAIYSNESTNGSSITNTGTFAFETAGTYTLSLAAITGPVSLTNTVSDSSGTLNLIKTGSNTVTLSGANTFKGTVVVNQGTLSVTTNATALGSTSGGAISVTSSVGAATLSLGVAVNYTSRSVALSGALVIANTGTNTFSSITTLSSSYIRATQSGTLATTGGIANGGFLLVVGAASGIDLALIPTSGISGLGGLTIGNSASDAGAVYLQTANTYTGNTTLAYGTAYVASSLETPGISGPLGNKSLTAANTLLMTGGILFYANGSVDYSGRFSTAGGQQWRVNTGASSVTFSSSLQGNSSLSLLGGDLSLSGNSRFSSFTNGVNLVNGTLTLDAPVVFVGLVPNSSPIGISGTITFTGGTLRYTTSNVFDYSARFSTNAGQQWKIDTNGESVVFASSLTSTGGSLTKLALGTLNLPVANAYNSGTTLSAGTLKCGNVASLGTGGLAQANSTVLHVTATGGKLTIQGAHTNTGTGSRIIRIGA